MSAGVVRQHPPSLERETTTNMKNFNKYIKKIHIIYIYVETKKITISSFEMMLKGEMIPMIVAPF
jgi:hypothetical protein